MRGVSKIVVKYIHFKEDGKLDTIFGCFPPTIARLFVAGCPGERSSGQLGRWPGFDGWWRRRIHFMASPIGHTPPQSPPETHCPRGDVDSGRAGSAWRTAILWKAQGEPTQFRIGYGVRSTPFSVPLRSQNKNSWRVSPTVSYRNSPPPPPPPGTIMPLALLCGFSSYVGPLVRR